VEKSRVQILVVVARIQVRILKAEEGKVSEVTVFGFGLVGPKVMSGARPMSRTYIHRKGIRLIFRNHN